MKRHTFRLLVFALVALIVFWGCTLPFLAATPDPAATMVVLTVRALQTGLAGTQTAAAVVPAAPPTAAPPSPTAYQSPAPTPTFSNPVAKVTTLCWTGPGSAYPVVSSVKEGTAVEVLGVGSKIGWLVIKNPTYGDRCWIEVKNLRLDPYFNTAGMQVFNPPPTPGPKITPLPTKTP